MAFKRKKNTRQRGSKTHGCGSMKKRRGAGHRGGRGNAGSGKKADQKKPSFWDKKKYFGKHYFKPKGQKEEIITTNIVMIERNLDKFEKKGDSYTVDLAKIGVNKLLGKGKATKKLSITVKYASQKAIDKISEAGGKVEITGTEETKKAVAEEAAEKPAEQ